MACGFVEDQNGGKSCQPRTVRPMLKNERFAPTEAVATNHSDFE